MRNSSIDITSSVLLIHMVCLHSMQMAGLANTAYFKASVVVFACLMPWFFFKSGIFFKQQRTKDLVIKEAKRLLVPFVVFSAIGHIVYMFYLYQQNDTNIIHYTLSPIKYFLQYGSIGGNLPLWFLTSLFVVKIVFNCIHTTHNLWLIGCIATIPYLMFSFNIELPVYVANISAGLFFYACGYYTKKIQERWYIVVPCTIIFVLSLLYNQTYIDMRMNMLIYGNYYIWYPLSLAGIIVIKNISRIVAPIFLAIRGVEIARNGILILCTHWIILLSIGIIFPNVLGLRLFIINAVALLVLIPLLIFASKRLSIKF